MQTEKQFMPTDLGLLCLRITVGGLMLFHGIHKLLYGHHLITQLLQSHGLPTFLKYGVPLGEVVAPLLLIAGVWVRQAATLIIITMLASLYLFLGKDAFTLDQYGALKSQLNLFFIGSSLALWGLGAGWYRVRLEWFRRQQGKVLTSTGVS
jgi:putative oxidoreductase